MKKLLFAAVLLFISVAVTNAQSSTIFKPFRFGLCVGYANPSGGGDAKGGVLFNFEPSYRIKDNIAVGLRGEFAVMARASGDASSSSVDASANGSWTLNGEYFFSNNDFRPFAGLGFGTYSIAKASVDVSVGGSSGSAAAAGNKFGFYPRIGFEYNHFVLGIDYNIIPASKYEYTATTGNVEVEQKNSYLGIRLGLYIGGGRR